MKGATLKRVMIHPLIAPITVPTSSDNAMMVQVCG